MRAVILHLPDATYEWLVAEAAAARKPVEQWMVDILTGDTQALSHEDEPQAMLMATLEALGFKRLPPEQTHRLSVLLKSRKEHPLSRAETTALQSLMDAANFLELTSLQRLAALTDC